MMVQSLSVLLLATSVLAQTASLTLTGTWSTKSNSTLTGDGFYNPTRDLLIEPGHTGISYSFTDDGFFESAYFRAVANPQDPACATSVLQWQHGTFLKSASGALRTQPIASDGRQLISDPCSKYKTTYSRFNQTETFKSFQLLIDPYHKVPRLNLFRFDGSPMPPMYIYSTEPKMLPTTTLHPQATPSKKPSRLIRRSAEAQGESARQTAHASIFNHWLWTSSMLEPDLLWWLGIGMSGLGGLLYVCF